MSSKKVKLNLDNYTPSRISTCVFADEDEEEGDIIETFMALPTRWRLGDLDPRCVSLKETALATGSCSCDFCTKHGTPFLIPTGNVSLYGTSPDANSRVVVTEFQEGQPSVGVVIANRAVTKGDGIFIDRRRYFMSTPADPVPVPETEEE